MHSELKTLKAIPIDRTKKANKENTKSVIRFGLPLESENFKRWEKEYFFKTEEDNVGKIL